MENFIDARIWQPNTAEEYYSFLQVESLKVYSTDWEINL